MQKDRCIYFSRIPPPPFFSKEYDQPDGGFTVAAFVRPLPIVRDADVPCHIAFDTEIFMADLTLERLLSSVSADVPF